MQKLQRKNIQSQQDTEYDEHSNQEMTEETGQGCGTGLWVGGKDHPLQS